MIKTTLQFQFDCLKKNPLTSVLVILIAALVLYIGYLHDSPVQSVAYLMAMYGCAFFADLYAIKHPSAPPFEVRKPKRESLYFIVSCILGFVFLYFRFAPSMDWQNLSGLVRLAVLPLIVFMFPIALAIILLLSKYKPRDLGIRLRGFIVVIPIVLLLAITNRLVSPASLTWNAILEESGGIVGAIISGIVMAGLSEEFFRFVGQTRLAAWFKNFGLAWIATTVVWAFMHAPKWYSENLDMMDAVLSSVRIIPIGLMWGYITHRTKSILPSTLIHGTNFWGLQNF